VIDWLRADRQAPSVVVGGRKLPIAIRRHARARRLTMRLAPDGSEVRITLPQWGRTLDALVFAETRAEWIAAQLHAVPEAAPVMPGGAVLYRGENLSISWDRTRPRLPLLVGEALSCGGPEAAVAARVQSWLEGEAVRLLLQDLGFYCDRAGEALPALRLSRAQRRWGSCSSSARNHVRVIRINWRLVMAPDFVRRSVVAHEVAHLTHFDHSPAFHVLLGRLFEHDLGEADGWLREHGRRLYTAFG